ncbi:MAG: asparagine synthase (glutamine-hydrolyzing) [Magnetococcus sp. DMHC-8]
MCGILGLIGTPWRADATTALATLTPRGPDAATLTDLGETILGHARLAVIDLTGGHQPMTSADGRYTIVFNGEIYNFQTLREELQYLGHSFATHSDTEVLLVGHAQWGEALLPRLDGMFAFAVWDRWQRRVFAARDRLGIKPFFYSTCSGLTFASTLAPFFCLTGFPRHLDGEALRDYLAFQTPLAPHSFLAGVRQLPPAHWLQYDLAAGTLQVTGYWSIPAPREEGVPPWETLVEQVDAALAESVRRQLVADVPLGAFLSGGIDSSLMVRYMAEAGARPLKVFSLRFAEAGFDETPHAREVARHFGCEHHLLDAPAIDGEGLVTAIAALDQPLADPAYVMTHALARLVRGHVTVALSGDGGDELFGGYDRFFAQEKDFPPWPGQGLARRLVLGGWLPGALLRRTLSGRELLFYRRVEVGPWPVSRKSLHRYIHPAWLPGCRPERTLERWHGLIDAWGGCMDTATLMRADLWSYLSENCLVKTDRASMAHGLEVRVPMLGNPVLESVLSLPARLHAGPGGKAILREIARRTLPATVWQRPKHGFSVPLQSLFQGPWREVCEQAIGAAARRAPFLEAGAVTELWQQALAGRASRRLAYTLVVLLLWLENHGVDGP